MAVGRVGLGWAGRCSARRGAGPRLGTAVGRLERVWGQLGPGGSRCTEVEGCVEVMNIEPRVTNTYLEHLSAEDLHFVLAATGPVPAATTDPPRDELRRVLGSRPGGLEALLGDRRVFDAVFGRIGPDEPLIGISPFLVFALAVHGAASDLGSTTYVTEWLGPRLRAPVFDVDPLREFLAEPRRRLFLAELLASYTHVASGSVIVPTRRGLRRQRFSELDPVRLAGLLDVISDADRPGVLRRLGDLALFLTGVFPDQVASRGFGPIEEGRLRRAGRSTAPRHSPPTAEGEWLGSDNGGAVGLLERLGRRWYGAAFDLMHPPVPADLAVIGELPERFHHARRILNLVTERFLFPQRDRWFGLGAE